MDLLKSFWSKAETALGVLLVCAIILSCFLFLAHYFKYVLVGFVGVLLVCWIVVMLAALSFLAMYIAEFILIGAVENLKSAIFILSIYIFLVLAGYILTRYLRSNLEPEEFVVLVGGFFYIVYSIGELRNNCGHIEKKALWLRKRASQLLVKADQLDRLSPPRN